MPSGPETLEESAVHEALAWAHPLVGEWFSAKFGSPTEPQIAGWPAILRGEATLISAPTGSGKTLAAFLVCIDGLLRAALEGRLTPHTHVVYISPLKALSNDVGKNLDGPLAEIQQLAMQRGYLCPEIRTGVRTGDTLTKDRVAMLKHPPHILVTTPESLYILLTARKSRENLTRVSTVIVDEIHAVADDKRGSHLALSLERLDALVCGENSLAPGAMLSGLSKPPQRIGLSATQNPIDLVGNFLVGAAPGRKPATVVQVGQRRVLDLAIEIPSDELGSLTTILMWTEIFDKLATLAQGHRSTLVFVNTRKLVEKISFELSERLGPDAVAAHHGSLARALRLDAEQRLKNGEIKILIATASLELGIDIGNVDLVCQIATTRAVAVAMQRVGRAGHWRGAIPKGRFFATTRDDLLEQAALLRKMMAGELDQLEIPEAPIDVLMQQIVAACGAESWGEEALYNVLRRAWPYRNLSLAEFDELLSLLHTGIESSRGRYGAYLLRDRVGGQLHARRGARMIAIGNGGAIPDVSLFSVMLQPENVQIATLDEHFAVDSSPGDVVLLGNTSWRIQRIDPAGKVLVEDAHGAPPSIPFWEGEAPQRTAVLSDGVTDLRVEIDRRTRDVKPSHLQFAFAETDETQPSTTSTVILSAASAESKAPCISAASPNRSAQTTQNSSAQHQLTVTAAWLQRECCLSPSAARQLISYVVAGRAVLGAVPTKTTIIAERFFDEGGGQQLIIHAPFGGRLNKAWGLALRKRFCRGFNFELQAAATDNGINISLAEQHSFPLVDVFQFLTEQTARELLEQASIPSPLFKNRWRWAAGRSLQLLRMQKGKRVAPQIQRTRSDDLLASVFPHASACPETITGDIEIPDHPLVREVMRDTLSEAMDIDGLLDVLRDIASGAIQCIAVDTPVPSQFAHELIHAMPYSFLDGEDAAARRTRAVSLRRTLPDSVSDGAGLLDAPAIDAVRTQLWPDIRDEHELHDLLLSLVILPLAYLESEAANKPRSVQHWPTFFDRLASQARAHLVHLGDGSPAWVATERLPDAASLWPEVPALAEIDILGGASQLHRRAQSNDAPILSAEAQTAITAASPRERAISQLTQGWLQILGPATAAHLAALTHLPPQAIYQALLAMEMQGIAMRGVIEHLKPPDGAPFDIEWCERRILQRIHRLTLTSLRKQVEPVAPAVFMRWLLDWHHVAPGTQFAGEEGVLAALEQLEGFEAPAAEWERKLLPARVANYDPQWLDNLCLAGIVGWGRISPHPAFLSSEPASSPSSRAEAKRSIDESEPRAVAPANAAPRRVVPTAAAPITFFLRESAEWLSSALEAKCADEAVLQQSLSGNAQQIRELLRTRGAAFSAELQRFVGLTKLETATALWELAAAGLASADGYDQLRAMMDPRRKSVAVAQTPAVSLRKRAAARTTAGRWSLLCEPHQSQSQLLQKNLNHADEAARAQLIAEARRVDAALDAHARILLCRYGVLFRELLEREANAPKWRDLAPILRRLEARGEIRGGRFVSGAFGEQFALPEAVDGLRAARREFAARASQSLEDRIEIAAADPLNLVGILVPGERTPCIPGRVVALVNGAAITDDLPNPVALPSRKRSRSVVEILRAETLPRRSAPSPAAANPGLFS